MSVFTSWAVMVLLCGASALITDRLTLAPGPAQSIAEGVLEAMRGTVSSILPDDVDLVFPYVATIWLFLIFANLVGVIPGLHSPTADLSTTAALAVLTFCFVHWAGIRSIGLRAYLAHYVHPNPIMLPFELMSELSRTVTLAVRLFGNMMSLELAAMIVVGIAGFLVPVPLLLLHVIEALLQAYIFGMLALVYVAGAVQTYHARLSGEGGNS